MINPKYIKEKTSLGNNEDILKLRAALEENLTREQTFQNLQEFYSFSADDAQNGIDKYWK